MKYYEVDKKTIGTTKYCDPHIMESSSWSNEKLWRNKYEKLHELPIPYYVQNKYEPKDYATLYPRLVSRRLLDIIKTLNKDYEVLESQMYYQGKQRDLRGQKLWDMYYTMIFPEYEVFSWEYSEYTKDISYVTGKEIVTNLKKAVLDKSKVEILPKENNLFCLAEKKIILVCTETAKQAIEAAHITGIAFIELEVR